MFWEKLFRRQTSVTLNADAPPLPAPFQTEAERRLEDLRVAVRESKNRPFRTEDYERERQLAFRVAELGESAVGPLCDALNDPDDCMREYATLALTRVPDVEARVKALVAAASRVPLGFVDDTTKGVVALGEQAVDPLLRALDSDDQNVRGRVGDAIAKLGTGAVEPLIKALDTPKPQVRGEIAYALARIGDRRATPHLIKLLGDEDENVRKKSALGFYFLPDPSAVQALVAVLDDDINSFDVKQTATKSLLELGWVPTDRDQEVLFAVLNLDPFGGGLRMMATADRIGAVVKFGTEAVEYLLVALESGSDHVRENAAKALGEIHDERARNALACAAANKQYGYQVRGAAKFALSKLGSAAEIQLATNVHGQKTDKPTLDDRLANRYGKCSKCASTVPLEKARHVYWDWDGVDAYGYFCPTCYIDGDIYTGRLIGRLGDDLVDQYS